MSDWITTVCERYGNDRTRLMDIVREVQSELGSVSKEAQITLAERLSCKPVEVESTVSFYAFLTEHPCGHIPIRLCNDVVDRLSGVEDVARAFERELGISMGSVTNDGMFGLHWTPCIGMSDQAPAALIGDLPVTSLRAEMVPELVEILRTAKDPKAIPCKVGDGNNASPLVRSMVLNHIEKTGPVCFSPWPRGEAVRKAAEMESKELLELVDDSGLRGRGGAAFPTGMKWKFAAAMPQLEKTVICNADEGEPGTFKDRVLLTEVPGLFVEGMIVAARAIGADNGILYLRGEYQYLRSFLEETLQNYRDDGLLGTSIAGVEAFDFDIRIQMGAGSYVCGEETALISSCEGRRGDPKTKPPFPAQKGYLGRPTIVNNVETFCAVTRILLQGPEWFRSLGTSSSPGTKLLSISGDCGKPGVYEIEFGITLSSVLEMAQATATKAVLVGGPSGQFVAESGFGRQLSFDDLATSGAIVVFDQTRDLMEVVEHYMEFFCEESCGYCTPCRFGNEVILQTIHRLRTGWGKHEDLDLLRSLGGVMKSASRCGLGQTSPHPVLSTMDQFPEIYESVVSIDRGFDLEAATSQAADLAGHRSTHLPEKEGEHV